MASKLETRKPHMVMSSGRVYVVDCQQKRFQQVLDPYDYISFDSPQGKELCVEFGVAK